MYYFKIKQSCELTTKLQDAKVMKNKWFDHKDEPYASVGLPVIAELVMSANILFYPNDPPKELRDQFKKYRENNLFVAKANSIISQQWRKMCAELGLTFVGTTSAMLTEALFKTPYVIGSQLKTIIQLDNERYLEGEKELPQAEFLEPISETDYFEARLKMAKEGDKLCKSSE